MEEGGGSLEGATFGGGGKGGAEQFGKGASPPNNNIYVAGLPAGIDDAKLKEVFSQYGEVVWHKVLGMRHGRLAGIVEFGSLDHASWVVENVHGSIPQGLTDAVDVKFKDEGRKGKGKGDRYSPYGMEEDYGGKGGGGGGGGWGGKGQVIPPLLEPRELQPVDNIYIKGLPNGCDEALLRQMFGNFGNITQCKLCPGEQRPTGTMSRLSALVRFSSVAEATAAIATMNGVAAGGAQGEEGEPVKLEVRYADTWDSRQKRNSDGTSFSIDTIVKGFEQSGLMPGGTGRHDNNNQCALYIAGLPNDTTDFHLFRMFSPLGAIAPRGVRALNNEDGTCKGIAFVNYLQPESTHMAIAVYNGAVMPEGGRLKVAVKTTRPNVQPQVVPAPHGGSEMWGEAGQVVPPPKSE